jgi:uncharacterized phage-associated protein
MNNRTNKDVIKSVITYFLKRAEEDNFPVGKVRITKLLYLLDVEYCRDHGETFTGFNWIFYKYGPYTSEIDEILSYAGIELEEEVIALEKSIKRLKIGETERAYSVDSKLENYLHRIWTEWGLESLPKLLDFVYFETEPMIYAKKRGESLDFSKISEREIPKKITWTPEEQKKLREIGKSIKEKLDKMPLPSRPVFPKETYEILKIWDEDEIADLRRLKGKVNMDTSILEETDRSEQRR